MAGDWIKMRADLFTHPKVFKIADRLGKDELYVVGALLAFWAWAHSHAVDGRVDGATSRLVDAATRVPGLSDALLSVGWLEVDDTGISIPRFDEHNGDSAKERILKNQRQARWRERKKKNDVDGKASTRASTNASTREEKRRDIPPNPPLQGGELADPPREPFTPPDWIPAEDWKAFSEMRAEKGKRAPFTDRAKALIVARLDGYRAQGEDVSAMLLQSVENGWSTVYPVKKPAGQRLPGGAQVVTQPAAANDAAVVARISERHRGAPVIRLPDGRYQCGSNTYGRNGQIEVAV